MTYPQAIVIAAALLAGAVLSSDRSTAANGASIALLPVEQLVPTGAIWYAAEGALRICWPTTDEARDFECTPFKM